VGAEERHLIQAFSELPTTSCRLLATIETFVPLKVQANLVILNAFTGVMATSLRAEARNMAAG
jgi:hypothetical protein